MCISDEKCSKVTMRMKGNILFRALCKIIYFKLSNRFLFENIPKNQVNEMEFNSWSYKFEILVVEFLNLGIVSFVSGLKI